ncbi:hypothetical protein PF008_g3371 [Phytophthora fragariae]|uniref:Uncharacterized protein n=1 Tax=Phytophthora fragariae TaxID=53985 RepID=A0A6G0SEC3_9STRA|nr:hypothetical protein PF008_g3371 [Phytophthora fragariae]
MWCFNRYLRRPAMLFCCCSNLSLSHFDPPLIIRDKYNPNKRPFRTNLRTKFNFTCFEYGVSRFWS